jgi:hypothetical protein
VKEQGGNVSDIAALVGLVGALSIEFFEISAKRSVTAEDVPEGEEVTASPDFSLGINRREDELLVRLKVDFETRLGQITVDAGAVYGLPREYVVPQSVAFEFANKVGIMALLPYLREAVHSITLKVFGNGLIMPVLRAGELEFFESELMGSESDLGS